MVFGSVFGWKHSLRNSLHDGLLAVFRSAEQQHAQPLGGGSEKWRAEAKELGAEEQLGAGGLYCHGVGPGARFGFGCLISLLMPAPRSGCLDLGKRVVTSLRMSRSWKGCRLWAPVA